MTSNDVSILLSGLPGADLMTAGLADAAAGRVTIPACLVWIALPRLKSFGLFSGIGTPEIKEPELTLYRLLRSEGDTAYSRYNSLLRRLVSFERALDQRASSEKRKLKAEI